MLDLGSFFCFALLLVPVQEDDLKGSAFAKGRLFLESKQFNLAAEQYAVALETDPEDPETSYMLGLSLFGAGRFAEAEEPLLVAAAAFPEDALPHEFLGRIYFQLARYEAASDAFKRAAKVNPREGRTFNHLGAVLLRQGKTDEALAAFLTAIRIDPSYAVAHYNVGVLNVMRGDELAGVYHLQEAARLDPDDPDPAEALSELYFRDDRLDEALVWVRASAERRKDSVELWVRLARLSLQLGLTKESERAYRAACDLPDCGVGAFLGLGYLQECTGRFDAARRSYLAALEVDPASLDAHLRMADLAEDLGDAILARRHLERMIDLGMSRVCLLRRLCLACERQGDTAGAVRAFQQLVLMNQGSQQDLLAIAGLMITSKVEGIGDMQHGYELVRSMVEGNSEQTAASLYVLAQAEAALGRHESAAENFKRAAGLLNEDHPVTTVLLREAELSRGDRR